MPNHITNRLTVTGEQSRINELYAQFSTIYPETQTTSFDGELTFAKDGMFGWLAKDGSFSFRKDGEIEKVQAMPDGWIPAMEAAWTRFPDFDKITPMPEGLIDTKSDRLVMKIENSFLAQETMKSLIEEIAKARIETVENFAKAIVNLKKHGHATWYGWSKEHWGTKWNSYSCADSGSNTYEFHTAWSAVLPLISKMAAAFPDLGIIYETSSEDTGAVCATYVFEGGELTQTTTFEYGTKEAYEHAFKLRPDSAQYYVLVDGNYEYKEDED